MTLIAGLKCVDGIVLAADTEESSLITRGRARKLLTRTFSKGENKNEPRSVVVAIAGAGSAALIDSAVEEVFEAVEEANSSTVQELRTTIREALWRFYGHDLSNYPTRDPLDNIIDLICGVRAANGELALYKTSGPLISTVTGFALSGSGDIFRHVLEELYQPTIAVPRAVALLLHLLNLGKRYVTGVGGDSEILTLMSDGIPFQESFEAIKTKEQRLNHFNQLIGQLLLRFPDASITATAFDQAMREIAAGITTLREKQSEDLERQLFVSPASIASLLSADAPGAPSVENQPTAPPSPAKKKKANPKSSTRSKR